MHGMAASWMALEQHVPELSELNAELSDTIEMLARRNAEKNALIDMIAHDLRNPLFGMLQSVRHLERQDNLETLDNRRHLAQIRDAVQTSMCLVHDFLHLKALETGELVLAAGVYELSVIVRERLVTHAALARGKGIDVVCNAGSVHALCDPFAIAKVIDNLMSNAIKFSPPATCISVNVGQQGNWSFVSVSDQGPGLTADDRRRLFTMFARLSAKPTAGEASIGVGLACARKLVEMMAGRITCESAPGHGATFIVELPQPA